MIEYRSRLACPRVETAGRLAQLRGRRLLVATSVAAGLGLVMILLTDLVLLHLH
jgi:hypothetical protein